MFTWNIAKSAESMFSRWAMKRFCKFALKKKLGQFILGEIDLDQLDVQLHAGTIQLFDLALNVDFLNQKLGQAGPVIIKEGSIGSLLVSMPWNGNGFVVEVDELELLLTPCSEHRFKTNEEASTSDNGSHCVNQESVKLNRELGEDSTGGTVDIHEGVKTVARMVKWFLTRFHVKVKRLIVAYDPYSDRNGSNLGICPNLVLRVSEIDCGARFSDDVDSESGSDAQNILGISCLTNFFTFKGAILELLLLDDFNKQSASPGVEAASVEQLHEPNASTITIPIITGDGGGFSGTMKLSIPWKDGSLDTRKVDSNVAIDPILLRIEPSTMKWIVMLWDSLQAIEKDPQQSANSVYYSASSQLFSSTFGSTVNPTEKPSSIEDCLSGGAKSSMGKEQGTSCLLPASLIISNWVPSSVNESRNQADERYEGLDFGSSVDQFLECFDGLRSSQNALASSRILSWTCSVFNAITAASNLASGSYYVPPEQKHIEANVRTTIASISMLFPLHDDNHYNSCKFLENKTEDTASCQYLVMDVQNLLLDFQASPHVTKLGVNIEHMELTYLTDFSLDQYKAETESHYMQLLQQAVEDSLPLTAMLARHDIEKSSRSSSETRGAILGSSCMRRLKFTGFEIDNKLRVQLLKTSGSLQCQVVINGDFAEQTSEKVTSFSLRLPPLVFWVDFHMINMLLELMPNMKSENCSSPDVSNEKCVVTDSDTLNASHLQVSAPPKQRLLGTIHVLDGRIILCFPSGDSSSPTNCTSWNQFVALDFSSLGPEFTKEMESPLSPRKGLSSKTSRSLHVNFGNLDIHLVSHERNEAINRQDNQTWAFSSRKIVSASSKSGRQSAINMIWKEGSLTGPSIIEKAKTLATSGMGNGNKFMGKGYEFASVNAVKDPRRREESCSQARNHFILSSSIILHLHLASLAVSVNEECYKELHRLLNKVKMIVHLPISIKETPPALQASLLVQCDSIELLIALEKKENIKKSLQSELPGSWSSLKLNTSKFEFLSVSEVGGIRGATFSWVSHCEGKLWGRVSETSDVDFLLISCSNSSMKRGDGQGSNTLSTSFAGSDIIHMCEPSSSQYLTSITIRCATIVAAGGRLDWFDAIPSFFSLPAEIESAGKDPNSHKVSSSFVLNLVDIGLSYEAYKNTVDAFVDGFEFLSPCFDNVKDEEPYFSCLLAASSLCISNTQACAVIQDSFKIRVQDLGLLLSPVSPPLYVANPYCAEHLRKVGYTKVASEALLEVIVSTNCSSGLLWEVEIFESHINLETCNDTTLGLIRLLSQLQQLLAPDVEESVIHLQTRWDSVQHAQANHVQSEKRTNSDSEFSSPSSMSRSNSTKSAAGLVGWMDEICDDAFQLEENLSDGVSELQFHLSSGDADPSSQHVPRNLTVTEPVSDKGLLYSQGDSCQNFIEDYCISAMLTPTELYRRSYSSEDMVAFKSKNAPNTSVGMHNGWYMGNSLEFVDDHISESGDSDQLQFELDNLPAQGTVKTKARVLLKNFNMRWRMNAGSCWHRNSSSGQTAEVSGRDSSVCLEFVLSGIGLQYEIFPDSEVLASKLALSVQDFHLYDRSKDAPWKLVLGYYHSKGRPRISSSKAIMLNLEAVRPDPAIPLEEYRLSMAFLPILVHLHQSQLDFITVFFGGISSSADSDLHGISGSKLSISESQTVGGQTISEEALLPFFQKFEIMPILLRVDYTPRGVDLPALGGGKYAELVNIVPWKGIEIQLKHVHAKGIYGLNSVCDRIVGEWLEDISQNQIHKLLQGLPTIRSLVSVGSSAAKLVTLPLKNYRKDQKLVKGMQRGTIAFLRSISLEAVALGVHLAAGAHDILFQAENLLSRVPPSGSQPAKSRDKDNIRANQPEDAQQGIIQACESLSSGLGEAASALIGTPLKKYHCGASPGSAFASAVCATPSAAIAPASAAVRAVHCALLGFRNSLDPEHKKESLEKYLGRSPSSDHRK